MRCCTGSRPACVGVRFKSRLRFHDARVPYSDSFDVNRTNRDSELYSDEKVANRDTRVWHGATETGP
jgi:hypothetical protein